MKTLIFEDTGNDSIEIRMNNFRVGWIYKYDDKDYRFEAESGGVWEYAQLRQIADKLSELNKL